MAKKGWYQVVWDDFLEIWEVVPFTGTFTFLKKYLYDNIGDANKKCNELNAE